MKWLYALLLFTAYNAYAGPHVTLYYACGKVIFAHFESPLPDGITVMGDITPQMYVEDEVLQKALNVADQLHPADYPKERDIEQPLREAGLLTSCPKEM